jgi:hypothetical protein
MIEGPGSLSMDGFTFAAPGSVLATTADVTVNSAFFWNAGTLAGAGNLLLKGTSNLGGGGGTLTLTNRVVTNSGIVNWQSGDISLTGGTTITNAFGAIFDAQCDASLTSPDEGTEVFDNVGLFKKTGGGGGAGMATIINCDFNNGGGGGVGLGGAPPGGGPGGAVPTVEADAGVIRFLRDGTHIGVFTASIYTQILFPNGTQTLKTGTTFQGDGLIAVFSNGTFTVPAGHTAKNLGYLLLDEGGRIEGSGITLTDGQFLNQQGTFLWTGGTILDLRFANIGGAMLLAGGRKLLDSSTFINSGSTVWTAGTIAMSTTNSDCQIINYGTFNVQANSQITGLGAGGFSTGIINATNPNEPNSGGVFKITNGATATINPPFDNGKDATLDQGVTNGTGTMFVPRLTLENGSIWIP